MEAEKEKVFIELLFEKYEEAMERLHEARRKRYEGEVEMVNLQERIDYLKKRIAYEESKQAPATLTGPAGPSEEHDKI